MDVVSMVSCAAAWWVNHTCLKKKNTHTTESLIKVHSSFKCNYSFHQTVSFHNHQVIKTVKKLEPIRWGGERVDAEVMEEQIKTSLKLIWFRLWLEQFLITWWWSCHRLHQSGPCFDGPDSASANDGNKVLVSSNTLDFMAFYVVTLWGFEPWFVSTETHKDEHFCFRVFCEHFIKSAALCCTKCGAGHCVGHTFIFLCKYLF